MAPPDLYAIVYEILETCTVPDFCLFLKTFTTNAALNGMDVTVEELLNKAEGQYSLLILSKKWNFSETSSFSFQAQQTSRGPPERDNRQTRNVPTWFKTPPTQDEPHERMHQNNTYKWCATCGQWFHGNRAHLTNKHVQGFQNQQSSIATSSANIVTHSTSQDVPDNMNSDIQHSDAGTITRTYFRDGL
jgi:hypothetical protein